MKGRMEHAKGSVKERLSGMCGDERLRGEGAADKLSGKARETPGKGSRQAGEAIDD
jgi:uncharacterized protein YjbJ (UPF0337 family)